jgi:hypothetical protein
MRLGIVVPLGLHGHWIAPCEPEKNRFTNIGGKS